MFKDAVEHALKQLKLRLCATEILACALSKPMMEATKIEEESGGENNRQGQSGSVEVQEREQPLRKLAMSNTLPEKDDH